MKRNPDRLIRKFLGVGGNDMGQEPTYMGFAIKFDFDNYINKGDMNSIVPGLLLGEDDLDSSINYLKRNGYQQRANYLVEFRDSLIDIQENKPWYFQAISGIEELWKRPDGPENTWLMHDLKLTVECLETVDLQMTFLAFLHRKGKMDRAWLRELLTSEKRLFNCRIIACEIRNLNKVNSIIEQMDNVVDGLSKKTSKNDTVGGQTAVVGTESNNGPTTGNPVETTDAKKYAENKAAEVKSKSVPGSANSSSNDIMGMDFSYIEQKYGEGKKILNDPGKAYDNLKGSIASSLFDETIAGNAYSPGGEHLDESKIRQYSKLNNLLVSLDEQISVIQFDLFDCEFDFNALPWAETLSASTYPEQATQRFDIIVGDAFVSGKFGFFQWVLHPDTKRAANPESWPNNDKLPNKYDDLKTSYVRDGFFMINDRQIMGSDPVPSKDALVDDSFSAKAMKYGGRLAKRAMNNIKTRAEGEINQAATDYLANIEKQYHASKMGRIQDALSATIDLRNPESLLDSYKRVKDELFGVTAGKTNKSDIAAIKRAAIGGNVYSSDNQPSLDTKQTADKNLNYRLLRQYKDSLTGDNKSIKNIGDEGPTPAMAPKDVRSGKLRKNADGLDLPNVGLEGGDHKTIISPIELNNAGHIVKPNGIKLEGAKPRTDINGIKLEGAKPKTKPTGIELSGAKADKKVTGIKLTGPKAQTTPTNQKLEGPKPLTKPSGIELTGAKPLTKPTNITLEGDTSKSSITQVTLEGAKPLTKPTGIQLTGAKPLTKPTSITLQGDTSKSSITQVTLEGAKAQTNINTITLSGNDSKYNITQVTLEGAKPLTKPTGITLEGSKTNKSITPIKLDGQKVSSTINKITLQGAKKNKAQNSNVGFTGPSSSSKIQSIKLEGVKSKNSIGKIKLTGAKTNSKITDITLNKAKALDGKSINKISLKGNTSSNKITGIKLDNGGKKGNGDITPIKLNVPKVLDKISQVKLDGAKTKSSINSIKLEGAKSTSVINKTELTGAKPKTSISKDTTTKPTNIEKKITKIELTGKPSQKKITQSNITGNTKKGDISPIKLDGSVKKTSKDISTIVLKSSAKQNNINPIKFDRVKKSSSITVSANLEGAKPKTTITKSTLPTISKTGKKISPIQLNGSTPLNKISPIKLDSKKSLTGSDIQKRSDKVTKRLNSSDIHKLSLTGSTPKTSISKIKLTSNTDNKTITKMTLDGKTSNIRIQPLKFEDINSNIKIQPVDLGKTPHLTEISIKNIYGETQVKGANSGIQQSPLEGANHIANIQQSPLESAGKLTGNNINQYKSGDK